MKKSRSRKPTREEPPTGRFLALVIRVEEVFFLVVLGLLIVLGLQPIVARPLGFAGISWGPALSQQMVLWLALFGAGAATRDRKHITVDALGQFLPERPRVALRGGTELLAAAICGMLTPVSYEFLRAELEYSSGQIAFLGIPAAWLPGILPLGFGLLALRLLLAAIADLRAAFSSRTGKPER